MDPRPTGRLVATAEGTDLVLTRSFAAEIDDVWASLTVSDRTERWFASWTGEPKVGGTIRYRLAFEGEAPEAEMRIDVCDPPMHLGVSTENDDGGWRLEARLTESEGVTRLTFVHHLDEGVDIGSIGPGWEYYLDLLESSRDGLTPPDFDDYYPAQQAYYDGLAAELRHGLKRRSTVRVMTTDAAITGIHHISVTVRDVEASATWYEQVFGMTRLPITFAHHDCEDTGYAVLLIDPSSALVLGLHHNTGNDGVEFDERRTGLDHFGFAVADRAQLDAWVAKLDELGIEHSGIRDLTEPIPFSTLVFHDPDNIQLELYTG